MVICPLKLLKKVVIPGAGVLPKIYPALIKADIGTTKKAPRAAAASFLPSAMSLPNINLIKPGLVKVKILVVGRGIEQIKYLYV